MKNRQGGPFWKMPWWEWLILAGSLYVFFAFCSAAYFEAHQMHRRPTSHAPRKSSHPGAAGQTTAP